MIASPFEPRVAAAIGNTRTAAPRSGACIHRVSSGESFTGVVFGIAATADKFETIWPGKSHPLLPHAIPDAVLMSAGDRYEELARRVQANYGKFDAAGARDFEQVHDAIEAGEYADGMLSEINEAVKRLPDHAKKEGE